MRQIKCRTNSFVKQMLENNPSLWDFLKKKNCLYLWNSAPHLIKMLKNWSNGNKKKMKTRDN